MFFCVYFDLEFGGLFPEEFGHGDHTVASGCAVWRGYPQRVSADPASPVGLYEGDVVRGQPYPEPPFSFCYSGHIMGGSFAALSAWREQA